MGRIVGAQEVPTASKAVAKHRATGASLPGLEKSSAVLVVGFGRQRAARVTAEGQVRMQDPGKRSGLQIQVWGSLSHDTIIKAGGRRERSVEGMGLSLEGP